MKKIEVMAKTVDSAIEKGLQELGIVRGQADIEILSEGGFLKQCKVVVSQKKTEGEKAADFVEKLLGKMKLTYFVELEETDDEAKLDLVGTDSGSIIGYRGEVLDAIQYLASLVANRDREEFKRVIVDTEGYREKRIATLKQLAKNLESKVIRTKRPAKLEPMNSFERRIIHSELQDSKEVTTSSEGVSPMRYVVISPKNAPSSKGNANRKSGGHSFAYRSDKKRR
jgi:spoIIIJ-associated protein